MTTPTRPRRAQTSASSGSEVGLGPSVVGLGPSDVGLGPSAPRSLGPSAKQPLGLGPLARWPLGLNQSASAPRPRSGGPSADNPSALSCSSSDRRIPKQNSPREYRNLLSQRPRLRDEPRSRSTALCKEFHGQSHCFQLRPDRSGLSASSWSPWTPSSVPDDAAPGVCPLFQLLPSSQYPWKHPESMLPSGSIPDDAAPGVCPLLQLLPSSRCPWKPRLHASENL